MRRRLLPAVILILILRFSVVIGASSSSSDLVRPSIILSWAISFSIGSGGIVASSLALSDSILSDSDCSFSVSFSPSSLISFPVSTAFSAVEAVGVSPWHFPHLLLHFQGPTLAPWEMLGKCWKHRHWFREVLLQRSPEGNITTSGVSQKDC